MIFAAADERAPTCTLVVRRFSASGFAQSNGSNQMVVVWDFKPHSRSAATLVCTSCGKALFYHWAFAEAHNLEMLGYSSATLSERRDQLWALAPRLREIATSQGWDCLAADDQLNGRAHCPACSRASANQTKGI